MKNTKREEINFNFSVYILPQLSLCVCVCTRETILRRFQVVVVYNHSEIYIVVSGIRDCVWKRSSCINLPQNQMCVCMRACVW